jgi:phosphatidylglycerol lysyltransferase
MTVDQPSTRSRALAVGASILHWPLTHPFSTAIVVLVAVAAPIARACLGSAKVVRAQLGTGYEPLFDQNRWWTLATSTIVTESVGHLLLTLVLLVTVLGTAERLMGTRRTAIVFAACAAVGPTAGAGLQFLGGLSGEFWSRQVTELVALDPATAIAGTLMAASSFTGRLWRRRIRVVMMLVALAFVLYSGQPADLYRLLAVVAALPLGRLLRSVRPPIGWVRSSAHEARVLMSTVVAITALGPMIALVTGSRRGPLSPLVQLLSSQVPDASQTLSRCQVFAMNSGCVHELTLQRIDSPGAILVTITPLLLLLVSAWGLLRGRRFAVWLAAGVNGLLGILGVFYFGLLPTIGLPYPVRRSSATSWETGFALILTVAIPLVIAVALILMRRQFPLQSSRRNVLAYLIAIAVAAVGLAALYVIGGLLVRDTAFTSSVTLGTLLSDVVERFIPVSFLKRETIEFLPSTTIGRLLYYGIGPVFWLIVIVGAIRPLRDTPALAQPGVIAKVRSLLKVGGGDSLAFMASWPGNFYWFDPESELAIAYRLVGRIAITLGAPFGALDPKSATVGRFSRFCDEKGWVPVFYSVDASLGDVFAAMGWHTMVVAEETVVRPAAWQTTGKKWQDVRSSINRAERAGITAVWTAYASLRRVTAAQLADISEQWIADKDLPEMGFTLGGLDELRDPEVRLMLAVDEDGRVQAVTSWLPSYRDGRVVGWTLDFMRRQPESINGVMEFLVAEAALMMQADGIEFMSLSAAPLAHMSGSSGDTSTIDRILALLSSALEPVYGFRSLLTFKNKFQPEHRPLLMAYPDPVALPAIGLALTRAYLPTLTVKQAARLVRPSRA